VAAYLRQLWTQAQVQIKVMVREEGQPSICLSTKKYVHSNAATRSQGIHPDVAILLCTMQGRNYLGEQLDSILNQIHTSWTIWASDDGSDDGTLTLLEEYQARLGKARLSTHSGPAAGFAANFLSLTCNANITADYYAYADQDDIWEADKLARALEWLQTIPIGVPALYCSRTRNVDVNNQDIGFSRLFAKAPSFANALVQSIAGGNTMVFNDAARRLLRMAGADVEVVSHDWWAYLLVTGCGGEVFYDSLPAVRYRQHDTNLVGTNNSWTAGLVRARMLLGGRFRTWNDIHIAALETIRMHLTAENQRRLNEFSKARHSGFFARLAGMKRSGIYRQTLLGNLGLVAAIIFKKI
jgi:glycosyltransferase involved in cell wall biosynthesis